MTTRHHLATSPERTRGLPPDLAGQAGLPPATVTAYDHQDRRLLGGHCVGPIGQVITVVVCWHDTNS
jgi:hypothetical protein